MGKLKKILLGESENISSTDKELYSEEETSEPLKRIFTFH